MPWLRAASASSSGDTADASAVPLGRVTDMGPSSSPEQLCASRVREPLLILLGSPAAFADEQLPDVRVVERPEDVRGACDVETACERPLLREALDQHPLVRVELGSDSVPQLLDVGVDLRGAADDFEQAGDAQLHDARVVRVAAQLALRVGFLENLSVPLLLCDRQLATLAAQP